MWNEHKKKISTFIILVVLSALSTLLHHVVPAMEAKPPAIMEAKDASQTTSQQERFSLSEQRRVHILYGDGTGGGHRAGTGNHGKTEFPASWSDEKILSIITRMANDANLPLRPSGRYWLRTGEEEGLQIRIVLDRERDEIITAYPINIRRNE